MPITLRFSFVPTYWNDNFDSALEELNKFAPQLCKGLGFDFKVQYEKEQKGNNFILKIVLTGEQVVPAKEVFVYFAKGLKHWELISEE